MNPAGATTTISKSKMTCIVFTQARWPWRSSANLLRSAHWGLSRPSVTLQDRDPSLLGIWRLASWQMNLKV